MEQREGERGRQQATLFASQEDDIEGYKLPSLLVNYGDETSEIDIHSEETIEWDDKVDIP